SERGDWLVEKLAEIGVELWQPLDCERARWRAGEARLERWRRLARAALCQSRQVWEMEILEPIPVTGLASRSGGGAKWLAGPAGAARPLRMGSSSLRVDSGVARAGPGSPAATAPAVTLDGTVAPLHTQDAVCAPGSISGCFCVPRGV